MGAYLDYPSKYNVVVFFFSLLTSQYIYMSCFKPSDGDRGGQLKSPSLESPLDLTLCEDKTKQCV